MDNNRLLQLTGYSVVLHALKKKMAVGRCMSKKMCLSLEPIIQSSGDLGNDAAGTCTQQMLMEEKTMCRLGNSCQSLASVEVKRVGGLEKDGHDFSDVLVDL